METKNLQEIFNETKELNTKHLFQDVFGNIIKIFGYIPSDGDTGLEFRTISNDHVFVSPTSPQLKFMQQEALPIFGNVKVLDKDNNFPLKQTYVSELIRNRNYISFISNIKSKPSFFKMKNSSIVNGEFVYNAKEGDLFFWKDQECILKKYGISKAFLVVGYYMHEGSYKYILTNPSEVFLIENGTELI